MTQKKAEQFTWQLQNVTGCFLLDRKMRDHAVKRSAAASIIMIDSMYLWCGVPVLKNGPAHELKDGLVFLASDASS